MSNNPPLISDIHMDSCTFKPQEVLPWPSQADWFNPVEQQKFIHNEEDMWSDITNLVALIPFSFIIFHIMVTGSHDFTLVSKAFKISLYFLKHVFCSGWSLPITLGNRWGTPTCGYRQTNKYTCKMGNLRESSLSNLHVFWLQFK